jgi:Cdc6-like AAA superfamily ATPase
MSNPKDWFRRRQRDPLDRQLREDARHDDDDLLQLDAPIPPDAVERPRMTGMGRAQIGTALADEQRASVPPPRGGGQVAPQRIEGDAFAVRPELLRSVGVGPDASAAGPAGEARPAGVPSVRVRAIPLARHSSPRAGVPVDPGRGNPATPLQPRSAVPPPSSHEAGGKVDALPTFTLAAPGAAWLRGRQDSSGAAHSALREAFTPTRPKQLGAQFAGRHAPMQRIICAIEEERAHVVLYGERGSGKTSLANMIAAQAEQAGYFVVRFACSSELSFEDIFRSFLRRIPATFLAGGVGATNRAGIANFEELVPPGEIGIAELVAVLARLHERHVILVIDEYDRVTNELTKNKLAELIKNMSDASAPVTLLLIGVAEDVDDLLGKHPSLQRTLVTVPLPLMTPAEIEAIIVGGEQKSGRRFAPFVRQRIVELSQGLPYHAQLLCLFAARSALRRRSTEVEREDLRYAVARAAEEAEGRAKEAYALAVASTQGGTAFRDVLFAAARCRSDAFGTFSVDDVATAAAEHGIAHTTLALQFPLKKLTEPGRGSMLRRIAALDGLRYQFTNQRLRHHVLVRQAVERGLV